MTQKHECRGGCKGTHPTICEQEGCAIVQGQHRREEKERERCPSDSRPNFENYFAPLDARSREDLFQRCGARPDEYELAFVQYSWWTWEHLKAEAAKRASRLTEKIDEIIVIHDGKAMSMGALSSVRAAIENTDT